MRNPLGIILLIIIGIFAFPLIIGIAAAIFGVGVGILGAIFGVIVGVISAIFSAIIAIPAAIFDVSVDNHWEWWHFPFWKAVFLVLIIWLVVRMSRKKSGSTSK